METFRAELHIHTCLSPCAEVEMIPPLIVQEALDRGIQMLAISDHNASANVEAVQKAAYGTRLHVLPGMELQTREEVHLLCLFDTLEQIGAWQVQVDRALPEQLNDPEYFGEQFVVDETGDLVRREERLLLNSTSLSLEDAFTRVERLGGLCIPAHIDRQAFGLIANLGFIPADLPVSAVEISRSLPLELAVKRFPMLASYRLLRGGDAHRLAELLGANLFTLAAPSIAELRKALGNEDGRRLKILS
jgi:PHP family Zn ribbon phosphoesterase